MQDRELNDLPTLPQPLLEGVDWELWGQNVKTDCYTADQMTAHAIAAVAAERKRIVSLLSGLTRAPFDSDSAAYNHGITVCLQAVLKRSTPKEQP